MTGAALAPGLGARPGLRRILQRRPAAVAAVLAVAMLVVDVAMQPATFGPVQQLAAFAPLALAAMAMVPSLIGGGLDLSVSAQMTLYSILFVGYLTPAGLGGYVAVPILLAIGAAVGAVNGLLVVGLRLPPVVVTLATMFILTGLNVRLAPRPVTLHGGWLLDLSGMLWIVPGGVVTVVVPLVAWGLLARTAYGRNLYALGGNDAAAYSAGMRVGLVRLLSYAFGGMLAAVAGLALTALVSSVDSSTSNAYLMGSIAAVALGGVSLRGGRGGMAGAIAGAAVIFLVQNLLRLFGVPQLWLTLVFGLLLLGAVVLGALSHAAGKDR